ncbi:MAG: hypothetical protein ACOVO2_15175 [Emticicia sp.]|uniref:hypothetical protein n=1 Tax=Emticicia sp. TaxID=1930953 RepID=UPI003BA7002F
MKIKHKKSVVLFGLLAFLTLFSYSCQNEEINEVGDVQNNLDISQSKNSISQKYSVDLDEILLKIINSKGFLAFEKANSDYESIKLKKGNNSKEALTKLQNIKSEADYEKFVNEYYQNPQKKLKQREVLKNSFLQFYNEIPELKSFSKTDLSFTLGEAHDAYIKERSNTYKYRSILDCRSNCQHGRDVAEASADRQFTATSAGCVLLSPTLFAFAVCEVVAAYIHDDQYDVAEDNYNICVAGCPA